MNGLDFKPFPLDKLPKPLARYAKEAAAAIGCDPAMVAVPMLAAVAGCVGSTRRIGLKRNWSEPAIVWGAIAVPSGTHKSPAIDAAVDPIRDIQAGWMRDRPADAGDGAEGGNAPPARRILSTDPTIEGMAPVLEHNPRGMIVLADELATWAGSFDSYNRKGAASTRAKWLEIFGGRQVMIDRKGERSKGRQEPIFLAFPAVSLCGGIQPAILSNLIDREAVAAGLDARLLLAAPPPRKRRWTERDVSEIAVADYRIILERMLELTHGNEGKPRRIAIEPAGKAAYIAFFNANGEALDDEAEEPMRSCLSKMECYAARLALCFHCVNVVYDASALDEWQADASAVTADEMADAIAVVRWFIAERGRVRGLKADPAAAARAELIDLIRLKDGAITARDLHRIRPSTYPNSEAATKALAELVKAGLGKWEHPRGPGRPTAIFRLNATDELT